MGGQSGIIGTKPAIHVPPASTNAKLTSSDIVRSTTGVPNSVPRGSGAEAGRVRLKSDLMGQVCGVTKYRAVALAAEIRGKGQGGAVEEEGRPLAVLFRMGLVHHPDGPVRTGNPGKKAIQLRGGAGGQP